MFSELDSLLFPIEANFFVVLYCQTVTYWPPLYNFSAPQICFRLDLTLSWPRYGVFCCQIGRNSSLKLPKFREKKPPPPPHIAGSTICYTTAQSYYYSYIDQMYNEIKTINGTI